MLASTGGARNQVNPPMCGSRSSKESEGLRDRFTTTSAAVVPDENARNGILPSGNITVSPNVQPYLDLYPLPNAANFGDGSAEFIFSEPIPTNEDYFMVKIDHNPPTTMPPTMVVTMLRAVS